MVTREEVQAVVREELKAFSEGLAVILKPLFDHIYTSSALIESVDGLLVFLQRQLAGCRGLILDSDLGDSNTESWRFSEHEGDGDEIEA